MFLYRRGKSEKEGKNRAPNKSALFQKSSRVKKCIAVRSEKGHLGALNILCKIIGI